MHVFAAIYLRIYIYIIYVLWVYIFIAATHV